jgi:hypothetical protein
MEAYFVNPVTRKAVKGKKKTKRRKTMAKRRQPAALRKYWAKRRKAKASPKKHRKARRKSHRKARRNPARAKHIVPSHHRKGGAVKSYRRKGAHVKKHWSNPMGMGQIGSTTVDGLVAAGIFFGALFAVGYANGWTKKVPMLAGGWGELAGKLGIALGVSMAAAIAVRKNYLSRDNAKIVVLAGFSPVALSLLGRVAPGIAAGVTLADEDSMDAELSMTPGHRLSDYTMDAELAAELQGPAHESESSSF